MIAASPNAVNTSNIECCLINTVERTMEDASIKDETRIMGLSMKKLLFAIAKCSPIELYTWILGQRFVAVSVLYRP